VKTFALGGLLATAISACATDVGIFDNTRVFDSTWNVQSGGLMTMFTAEWEARGAAWHQTGTLTTSFLSGVKVFYTGEITASSFTDAEKAAAMTWVQAGGTLIVTCDCPCEGNQPAYNTLLNQFGFTDSGATAPEATTTLNPHRLTRGFTSINLGVHGALTPPADALPLMQDQDGHTVCALLQGTATVGQGRLLVISDNDCFTDFYQLYNSDNETFTEGLADWAMRPYSISGHVTANFAVGALTGLPLSIQLYDGTGLLETIPATIDGAGNYSASSDYSGGLDVRGTLPGWLAIRASNVTVSATTLDWNFAYGGDENGDNAVNLVDLGVVLLNYDSAGPDGDANLDGHVGLTDLGIVLLDFNMAGDQ
jgi:hypothetical protein